MKSVLIAGGSGLIGQRLAEVLSDKYEVRILSRQKTQQKGKVKYFHWDPSSNTIDEEALKSHVIINLAGAGIADSRWTSARKKELIESRVKPTEFLAQQLQKKGLKPLLYIGASAIGLYGDQGNNVLTEKSPKGQGFLAECSELWEEASRKMEPHVERFIVLRIGIVLSKKGGAYPKLVMTAPVSMLNYFGDGSMYYSWIHIDDVCGIIATAIEDSRYSGVYNTVAPEPLTNKQFIKEIAQELRCKLVIPAPSFAIKIALGEMAAVVLNSNRVVPDNLMKLNHRFLFTEVGKAVRDIEEKGV